MLILPDSADLGDKRLSPEEGVKKLKEKITSERAQHKLVKQDELENLEMSLGRPMPWQELCRRIKQLNPALIVCEGGYPGAMQVRAEAAVTPEDPSGTKYVTGFMKTVLSEFDSVTQKDKWGVAKRVNRGWRTAVMDIVLKGYATKAQADQIMGEALGQRAWRWEQRMQNR